MHSTAQREKEPSAGGRTPLSCRTLESNGIDGLRHRHQIAACLSPAGPVAIFIMRALAMVRMTTTRRVVMQLVCDG
jgi:hypothetical protein